jgi:hypothetical protein
LPQFAVCGIEVNVGTLLVRGWVSTWTIASFLIDVNFQEALMAGLHELLSDHNWYTLRAIAYANNQAFDSQSTKAQAVAYVSDLLANPATVRRALSNLPDNAHEALQTLLACGGELPAHRFLDQFGPLRPFRPWHDGSPSAPWRHPVSPAERLWFLGLVFLSSAGEDEVVTVPDEILAQLPTPSLPSVSPPAPPPSSPIDPVLDLAHLLAYLQGHDVKPFAGRWLTLRHLRALNLGLAHPDPAVEEARSELQTGYLRFVHYLAEAANLAGLVGGLLKPTPAAWTWLEGAEPERWRVLWRSWQRDLNAASRQEPLWDRYRFPAQPAFVLTVLDTIGSLATDGALRNHPVELPRLVTPVRRRCIGAGTLPPDDDVLTPLQMLIRGPLTWGCMVSQGPAGAVALASLGAWLLGVRADPPQTPLTRAATAHDVRDHLRILLPEPPHRPSLRPLVALGLPASDRRSRRLTRQRFVSSLARGPGKSAVVEALREVTLDSLPARVTRRLQEWEEEARGLTLRRLTVLTVADTDLLEDLAGQRTIRELLVETLSPHHVVIDPNQLDRLLHALRRRGQVPLVEPGASSRPPSTPDLADAGAAAHLWLALRTYLHLADLVQLPTEPPAALLDHLEALINEDELTALISLAEIAQRRLHEVIEGYAAFPAPLPDVDHAKIERTIERALEEACPVRLVYHTAGRGERTERVVEPLRIDERGGTRYLVAYCRLRQDERVFRIDRIESAVLQDDR